MRKKIVFLLAGIHLLCAMVFPVGAVQSIYQETEMIYTAFGTIEKVSTITVHDTVVRSNSKSADRVDTYRYNGNVIAEITLSAAFGYDGNTAWVTSASGSHTTCDGWSYSNEKITKSGGTATLTARLTHAQNGNIAVNTSLTCSPTGQIS